MLVSIATCSVGIISIVLSVAMFEWVVYQLQLEPPDHMSSTTCARTDTHVFILQILVFIEMSMNEGRLFLSLRLSKFVKMEHP